MQIGSFNVCFLLKVFFVVRVGAQWKRAIRWGFNWGSIQSFRGVCVLAMAAEGMCADLLIWGVGCGYRLEGGMRDGGCG